MDFFSHFSDKARGQLQQAARHVVLDVGEPVLRLGDHADGLFLLETGSVAVVDTRQTPEVILDVIRDGELVGELSFVDGHPRSADVRTLEPTRLLRWSRADLEALCEADASARATLYQLVARAAVSRTRRLTAAALAGTLGGREANPTSANFRPTLRDAQRFCTRFQSEARRLEAELRARGRSGPAERSLRALLDRTADHVDSAFRSAESADEEGALEALFHQELHPWLNRSALVARCAARPQGVTATAEILSHIYLDLEDGEGRFGEVVDRWTLDRPTVRAIRQVREQLLERAIASLSALRRRHVLVATIGTGSLVAQLLDATDDAPSCITVAAHAPEALAFLDPESIRRETRAKLDTLHARPSDLALGAAQFDLEPQDLIIVQGLLEYLPNRIATAMLRGLRRFLAPGGRILVSTLGPSDDARFVDYVLAWPTVRRTAAALDDVVGAARLEIDARATVPAPGCVFSASTIGR